MAMKADERRKGHVDGRVEEAVNWWRTKSGMANESKVERAVG